MSRVAPAMELSKHDREKLELIASRRKTSQRDSLRARIILACAQGKRNQDVAEESGVCKQTVGKSSASWRVEDGEIPTI